MSPLEIGTMCFNNDASTFAFRAGQILEMMLLDRGLQRTRSSGSSVVTGETVEAGVDDTLFEEFKKRLNERSEQDVRKAA